MVSKPDFAAVSGEATSGLFGVLTSAFGSVIRHIQALFSLAGFEAKMAGGVFVKGVIFLGIALLAAAFGYILFVLFLAFMLYLLFGVSWLWILLGLCVLHFVIVLVVGILLRGLFRQKLFPMTMRELRLDVAGLTGQVPEGEKDGELERREDG